MSKLTIVEGNSNDKDNVRAIMVKGEKGDSAYDLYVKNGGTLTEEEWLDAFLNAENYYTKSEVDESQTNQNNKINKKPYYFNNVAEMKAYNLAAGDTVITNGYYATNDGGGALYTIRTKTNEDVEDNASIHFLQNNLVAELTESKTGDFIKTKFLNLSALNTEEAATENYEKICKILNKGYNLYFTDNYYFKNADISNAYPITRKTYLYGENNECGISFFSNNSNYLFVLENGDLYLERMSFNSNDTSYRSCILRNSTKDTEKYKYGNIYVENCIFNGLIELIYSYQSTSHIYPASFEWGMGEISVTNCIFENILSTFIDISRMPCKYITFNDNRVHNFSYCLIKVMWNIVGSDDDDDDTINQYRKFIDGVIVKNNYVINDDNVFGIGNLYYSVVAAKCREIIIENNYVEGMKSIENSTSLNPFYAIAEEVIVKNNVCKNNVNFSGYENKVIKSKAGLNSIKTYINNNFIIEKDFLTTINNSFDNPYSSEDLITNCTFQLLQNIVNTIEFNISDNVFEIPYINNQTTSSAINNFIFNNNKLICDRWEGYLIRPTSTNSIIEINDNIIEIKENTNKSFSLINADYALPNSIINVNNNNIKCNNNSLLVISLNPPAAESGATIAAKSLIMQNNIIYNQGTPSSSNTLFNIYRGKISDLLIFKNNYYYTNGKERFYRLTISDKPIIYDIIYESELFNDTTALQNSIIQFDNYIYTTPQKYKLSLEFDDTQEMKLNYYFTLFSENGVNYIKYKKQNEETETISPIFNPTQLTSYMHCESNPTFTNFVRLAISSTYNQIRFNNSLFSDGHHKVKIKVETI